MMTFKRHILAATIITGALVATQPAMANTDNEDENNTTVVIGGATGATMGAVVAGPVGAVVGGVLGLMIGNDVEQEKTIVAANQALEDQQQSMLAMQEDLLAWQQKALVQPVSVVTEAEPLLPEFTTSIQFKTGLATIEPVYNDQLVLISDLLQSATGLSIHISGYADPRGDAAHNRELSQQRADAVKQELVAAGVDPVRISTSGNGEKPEVQNASFESYFFDRKAVLMIAPTEKMLTAKH